MNFTDRPREGSGSNNKMSLWTWPWTDSRRILPLRRKQQRPLTNPKLCVMMATFGLMALLFWGQISYFGVARDSLTMIDLETRKASKNSLSLAVLVAGSTQRFLFNSFVDHVANNDRVVVDYFGILTLQSGPAFRQDAGYMNHLAGRDTIFKGILDGDSNESVDAIQAKMMNAMTLALKHSKTKIRALRLLQKPIEYDSVLDEVSKKEEKIHSYSDSEEPFDMFRQFPMMDHRKKALKRTQAGNKNMIRLFLALESLYKTEFWDFESKRGTNYDYVLILRDDTLWLDDFDLHKIIATDPDADAYILSCDARDPKMLPPEINDHGILIKREKADVVGKYVEAMTALDLQKCHSSVEEWLGKDRGCNSEMILKHVLKSNRVRVKLVPQSLLPFQRAVLIGNSDGEDYYCYHKFCQSVDEPLKLPPHIQKCKELTF